MCKKHFSETLEKSKGKNMKNSELSNILYNNITLAICEPIFIILLKKRQKVSIYIFEIN